jgi:hypothetical protein
MIERLGNVIYWTCNAIAAMTVAAGIVTQARGGVLEPDVFWAFAGGFALLVAIFGRAVRYVFVGK